MFTFFGSVVYHLNFLKKKDCLTMEKSLKKKKAQMCFCISKSMTIV